MESPEVVIVVVPLTVPTPTTSADIEAGIQERKGSIVDSE